MSKKNTIIKISKRHKESFILDDILSLVEKRCNRQSKYNKEVKNNFTKRKEDSYESYDN